MRRKEANIGKAQILIEILNYIILAKKKILEQNIIKLLSPFKNKSNKFFPCAPYFIIDNQKKLLKYSTIGVSKK